MNTMTILPLRRYVRHQEGAVLIVALMLLIVLTMLGISAMESTKLETRMAANTAEYNHAFQIAEYAMGIPRHYNAETVTQIAQGKPKEEERRDVQRGKDSQGNSINYYFQVRTARVEGSFLDQTGRFGAGSASMVKFIVSSTGRSRVGAEGTEDETASVVTLRGGLEQPSPPSKNSFTTN